MGIREGEESWTVNVKIRALKWVNTCKTQDIDMVVEENHIADLIVRMEAPVALVIGRSSVDIPPFPTYQSWSSPQGFSELGLGT